MQSFRITLETPEGRRRTLLETRISVSSAGMFQTIIPAQSRRELPVFIIDPARTGDPINDEALDLFLEHMNDSHDRYFDDESYYKVVLNDPETHNSSHYRVKLLHHMIKWPCKKNNGRFHYDVLQFSYTQNQSEKGGFGHIINTPFKLTPSYSQTAFTRKQTDTIYKVQCINYKKINQELDGSFDSEIQAETRYDKKQNLITQKQQAYKDDVALALKSIIQRSSIESTITPDYLHMRQPIVLEDRVYLRMKRMPGVTLQEVLSNDKDASNELTLKQRFSLARALLQAIKTQVSGLGRVHRDLKPENILAHYDQATEQWTVNIVDFGLAKWSRDNDINKSYYGTLLYMSPESYNDQGTSEKSDVFAAGIMIGEIFGACRDKCCWTRSEIIKELTSDIESIDPKHIFNGIIETDKLYNTKGLILDLISQMTCYDRKTHAANRFTIDQAIEVFNDVTNRLQCIQQLNAFIEPAAKALSTHSPSLFNPFINSQLGVQADMVITVKKLIRLARNTSSPVVLEEDDLSAIQSDPILSALVTKYQQIGILPATCLNPNELRR